MELFSELLAIHEVDGDGAVARRFSNGIAGEVTRGDEQAFVRAALHGSTEVADLPGADGTAIPLALEDYTEAEDAIDLGNPTSVDPAVARLASDFNLREAGFPQDALDETLEGVRRECIDTSV